MEAMQDHNKQKKENEMPHLYFPHLRVLFKKKENAIIAIILYPYYMKQEKLFTLYFPNRVLETIFKY